ncbi:MAG: hypothetical protein K8R23_00065 [Chthoniobacter sp.]|nr:hypothetical protein [Chthoniobacter sp.]
MDDQLTSGVTPISFSQFRVELAKRLMLRMPMETTLCTLWVLAVAAGGTVVARNFVQFFVDAGFPPLTETESLCVVRTQPHEFSAAQWSGRCSTVGDVLNSDSLYGEVHGWFEWRLLYQRRDPAAFRKLRVLCEASSRLDGCSERRFCASQQAPILPHRCAHPRESSPVKSSARHAWRVELSAGWFRRLRLSHRRAR